MTDTLPFNVFEPTMQLRFVEREGKRVLQQKMRMFERHPGGWFEERIFVWRDVPFSLERT